MELFPFGQWYWFAVGILLHHGIRTFAPRPGAQVSRNWIHALDLGASVALYLFFVRPEPYCSVALILLFLASVPEKSVWGTIARSWFFRSLGICCYSIYLFHGVLIIALESVQTSILRGLGIEQSAPWVRFSVWFPIFVAISLGLGTLSFRYLETFFIGLGKRVIDALEKVTKDDTGLAHTLRTGGGGN